MSRNTITEDSWLYEIKPKGKLIDLNFKEIWSYRDLLVLFVKRDIVTVYKQTILGPLWFLIQPLFTSIVFTLIFNNIGNVSTGAVPAFLFNLAGITFGIILRSVLLQVAQPLRQMLDFLEKYTFLGL